MKNENGYLKRFMLATVVLLIALLVIGSGVILAQSEEPQYGGTLKIVNTAEGAAPLGVPWENTTNDSLLMGPCIESLVKESTGGEMFPYLATSWDVDTENNIITFHLRKGVKFHDGTDFNAEAAQFSLQQAMDTKVVSGWESVDVIDEYTIAIKLKEYSNLLFTRLSSRSLGMISPTAFKEHGIEWARNNPVGTGPFKFESFQRGSVLRYVRNDNYWQEGKPYLDAIEYHFIRDTMTQQVAMMSSGEQRIDVLCSNSGELINMLRSQGLRIENMSIGPVSLMPSSKDPDSPLADSRVRRAISYAIDRKNIVQARGFGVWEPAYQFVPEAWSAHMENYEDNRYNPEKAKQLLEEAGYADGFKTTIYSMPGFVDKSAIEAVQNQLGQVGIDVELEFPDSGGYSNLRFNGWTGLLAQHTRAFPNIHNMYMYYIDNSAGYFPSMKRPNEVIELFNESVKTPEIEEEYVEEINRIIMEEMIVIPLYHIGDTYILRDYVHDTGFTEWGSSTMFIPEDSWISKFN